MKKVFLAVILMFAIGFIDNTNAQLLDKLKKKTEEKVKSEAQKRAEKQIDKGVEKVFNEAEKQISGTDEKKGVDPKTADSKAATQQTTQQNNKQNTPANQTKNQTQNSNQNAQPASATVKPTEPTPQTQGVINTKYDFIPGEKVIFFDDFTAENIGDFPIQWNTTGSGEVVTTNLAEGRWFHITNNRGITTLNEPLTLPDNYTIEFDIIPQKSGTSSEFNFYLINTTKPKDLKYGLARPGGTGIKFNFGYNNYYASYYADGSPDQKGMELQPKLQPDKKYRMSFWVQKERIRLYIDNNKLFDLPRAVPKTPKFNMIRFDTGTPLVANVRVATGLPDMRSKLLTEGKLISYGIYFDVNKDVVKSESYPSIKEIAAILQDNPSVRIQIVGHTDSDGENNFNLDLSKRRAAAVKNFLVSNFGIDGGRIETDGKGESAPVAPNDSATNKALNRRVEFIKL